MEVFTIGLVIESSHAAESVEVCGRGWSRFGRSHGNSDQLQTPGHREDAPAPATPPLHWLQVNNLHFVEEPIRRLPEGPVPPLI